MKVIFLQDVPNVAQAGQVKEVADGYARNYLIPRKLAAMAQPQAVSQIAARTKKIEARLTGELTELAGQLEGKEVSLKAKAGAKEKLYGSITSADIAAELKNVTGIEVDKRKIELEEPIRQLGSYEIAIKLGKDIAPKVRVTVTEEEAEEKPAKKEKKTAKKKEAPKAEEKAAKEKKTTKKAAKTTKAAEKKTPKKAAAKTTKKEAKAKKEEKTG
ncbi:MAG: 50S ribosomal protein L9 [Deltaproteobacteria bacterium]|nr:50S ribosomal protein L9 [Deltaproteobacteria bacterium]